MEKKRQLVFLVLFIVFLTSVSAQTEPSVLRNYDVLEQGKNIMFITNVEIAFTQLHFSTDEKFEDVTLIVQKKNSVPNPLPSDGILYQYVLVEKKGINNSDIDDIQIKFRVTKKWVNENNINKSSVSLFRHVNSWDKQESEFYLEDDTFYYYNCTVNGFSYFAVVGYKNQVIEIDEPEQQQVTEPIIEEEEEQKSNSKLIFIIALGIIMVLGILFINFRDKLNFSAKNTEDLINYIKLAKSQGENNSEIKTKLINEGWGEKEIDKYLNRAKLPEKIKEKLKNYVEKSLNKGKDKEDIRKEMIDAGWQNSTIDEVFKNFS